jgi:NADH-quinone oxidoreductase subunit I
MRPISLLVLGCVSILKGLSVTFHNLFMRKNVTIQYPKQLRPISERYRGMFYLKWNEEKERLNCVGCTLCAQACPTDVITMHKVGKGPDAGVDEFTMNLGRCMFCELCVEACPFDAIYMGGEYEFVFLQKDGCVKRIADLAQGGSANVERNTATLSRLAGETNGGPAQPPDEQERE